MERISGEKGEKDEKKKILSVNPFFKICQRMDCGGGGGRKVVAPSRINAQ